MLSPFHAPQLVLLTMWLSCRPLPDSISTYKGGSWQASDPVALAGAGAWVKLRNIGAFATCGQLQAAYHAGSKW